VTIIDFILARYAEREQAAQAAAAGGRWSYEDGDSVGAWTLYDEHWNIASLTVYDTKTYNYSERLPAARNPAYVDPDANGRHIALNDPAYVLADLAAKQRIVRQHTHYETEVLTADDEENVTLCRECMVDFPCDTLRLLASPFAGHPDYDEAWQPV
jgi:hypothetical protein